MPEETREEGSADTKASKILFHYIKSNYHRPIYVEGIFGGLTPRGLIQMSVFSEHDPIPQQSTYEITPGGTLGKEMEKLRVSREGVVRDVEATLLMSEDTARAVLAWLTDRIACLEQVKAGRQKR